MDSLQISRRKIFFDGMIKDNKLKGIEIGPFSRPTVLPDETEIYYADYYDTEELRAQAKMLNIPEESVPQVHYILKSAPLHSLLQENTFDFIIANHVLEHVIDPFRWIKDLEPMLKANGRFLITLPDKRLSFDKFRSDTGLAHFIEDFLNGGEKSIAQHAIEAAIYYDKKYVGRENYIEERLNSHFLESARTSYHPGMHVHVFQAESFLHSVLRPFLAIGWLNLSLETFEFNEHLGEFSFSLIKTDKSSNINSEDLFKNAYDTLPMRKVSFKSTYH